MSRTWHQQCNSDTALYPLRSLFKTPRVKQQSLIESRPHTTRAQWVYSKAENSAVVAIVKRLEHLEMRRSTNVHMYQQQQKKKKKEQFAILKLSHLSPLFAVVHYTNPQSTARNVCSPSKFHGTLLAQNREPFE